MLKSDQSRRRFGAHCFFVMGLVLVLLRPAVAQRAMPDPALLPSANPLCDGILVPCLVMDDFAGHAYLQPQVLPGTSLRDTTAVIPFGVALGLAGRVASSVSTHYAFWKEGDILYQQFGPLRLNLTVRLLPIFPLGSGGDSETSDTGQVEYVPPRGFRLGLAYEHEVRVWKFDGANSLGLLTNLASLRLVGSRIFGPLQLSGNLGALYDWSGQFATGEIAAQVGLYLPFFQSLKVYVEALGRGFPAIVKKDALMPLPDSLQAQDPIHPQGALGLGTLPTEYPSTGIDVGISGADASDPSVVRTVTARGAVSSVVGTTGGGRPFPRRIHSGNPAGLDRPTPELFAAVGARSQPTAAPQQFGQGARVCRRAAM